MRFQQSLGFFVLIVFGMGTFYRPPVAQADQIQPAPSNQVSAYDLIIAMNTLRVSYAGMKYNLEEILPILT